MSIDEMFGQEFLRYIDIQQKEGKSLADIASEHGKTKEAIRSKIKREKQKINAGVVQKRVQEKIQNKKEEVQNIPQKNKEKTQNIPQKKVQEDKVLDDDINIKNIIKLLEKIERNTCNSATLLSRQELRLQEKELKNEEEININYGYTDITSTSIRVSKKIWDQFKQFTKKSKYRQQDLVSQALQEFIAKYGE